MWRHAKYLTSYHFDVATFYYIIKHNISVKKIIRNNYFAHTIEPTWIWIWYDHALRAVQFYIVLQRHTYVHWCYTCFYNKNRGISNIMGVKYFWISLFYSSKLWESHQAYFKGIEIISPVAGDLEASLSPVTTFV